MKTLISGYLLLSFITLQPLIGYYVFKWLLVPVNVQISMVIVWVFTGGFQYFVACSLVVEGYKNQGIEIG